MIKKKPDVTTIVNELEGASVFFQKSPTPLVQETPAEPSLSSLQNTNEQLQDMNKESRTYSRENSRRISRKTLLNLPSREEIQEFSFRLRDEFKVKVQAEVPYQWQDELNEIANKLKVGKLELYRFIMGEFLGKVQRDPMK